VGVFHPGVDLIKLFWSIFTYSFFVSYTILELWTFIVSNNEMVYLTQNPEKITPKGFMRLTPGYNLVATRNQWLILLSKI
jgi:hypothetical protein